MLVILMVLVCTFVVTSQVFLKYHVVSHPLPKPLVAGHVGGVLWDALCSYNAWLFGVFMLAGGLLWIYVINNWQLSQAYPMISFVYVLMMLASWLLFKEPITLQKLAGTALVCVGVVLLSR